LKAQQTRLKEDLCAIQTDISQRIAENERLSERARYIDRVAVDGWPWTGDRVRGGNGAAAPPSPTSYLSTMLRLAG
jgi:hypothetical protein